MTITVFYGSQTGCAESIAKRIHQDALARNIESHYFPLNQYDKTGVDFAQLGLVIVVCSTTGNGDPPENCEKFWRYAKKRTHPKNMWEDLQYTVLGLGDTNYNKFCYMGMAIDKRLNDLGAQRFYPMCAADEAMGLEDFVEPWIDGLWPAIQNALRLQTTSQVVTSQVVDPTMDKKKQVFLPKTPNSIDSTVGESILIPGLRKYDISQEKNETIDEVDSSNFPKLQQCTIAISTSNIKEDSHSTTPSIPMNISIPNPSSTTSLFHSILVGAKYLANHKDRRVIHLDLDISLAGYAYNPGDSIGIYCPNRLHVVEAMLKRLNVSPQMEFTIESIQETTGKSNRTLPSSHLPTPCTALDVFLYHVNLTNIPRKSTLRMLAEYCHDPNEKKTLLFLCSKNGKAKYKEFIEDQRLNVPELLEMYPSCQPPLDHLLCTLPPMNPRYYSIASSPLIDKNRISIALSVVEYSLGNQENVIQRTGLCSTWLETISLPMLQGKETLVKIPIFLNPTKDFLLPASQKHPVIMIGPGTGVAPFIGFLQHRLYQKKNQNIAVCSGYWRSHFELSLEDDKEYLPLSCSGEAGAMSLYFGCRSAKTDWIYAEDMHDFVDNGVLSRLCTAFSRDQEEKDYVQHHLLKNANIIYEEIMEKNAYVYVCGDGAQMAKDVHLALVEILCSVGNMEVPDSEAVLKNLTISKRYIRDIWS